MTTTTSTPDRTATLTSLRAAVPTLPRRSALLAATAFSLIGLAVAAVGLLVDGRTITGVPAWLKPAKFGISIAVYCATLAWFLSMVRGHRVLVRVVGWTTAVSLVAELVLIGVQVVRGTTSHFNTATPLDSAIFSQMGNIVIVVFLAGLLAAVLLLRERSLDRTLGAGIRAGFLVCLAGMLEANLMFVNTAFSPTGGHTVGGPDGGPGLPMTGWSTQYGDLRVAHFVGLHALQALPLVAWLLLRHGRSLAEGTRVALVRIAGAATFGLVAILAWQAMRALPLLRPDAVIATALAVLVAATAASTAVVLRRDRAGATPGLAS